jgi:hypothetical protein
VHNAGQGWAQLPKPVAITGGPAVQGGNGPRGGRKKRARLCIQCHHRHEEEIEWEGAADWILWSPLDTALLHGRRWRDQDVQICENLDI